MTMPLSSYSPADLIEMQSFILTASGIFFHIEKPNKADNIDQARVLKCYEKINATAEQQLGILIQKKIIIIKRYLAGLGGEPVAVIYKCDFEQLKKYIYEHFQKKVENEEKLSISEIQSFEPAPLLGRLYFLLTTNKYDEFAKTLANIETVDESLESLSRKINSIKSKIEKSKLQKRFDLYKDNCMAKINEENYLKQLNRFSDKLLEASKYDPKRKKVMPFREKLEDAVKKFKSGQADNQEKSKQLYQEAKTISANLKLAHYSQLFSCAAKPGNRSKMATHIDGVLETYPKPFFLSKVASNIPNPPQPEISNLYSLSDIPNSSLQIRENESVLEQKYSDEAPNAYYREGVYLLDHLREQADLENAIEKLKASESFYAFYALGELYRDGKNKVFNGTQITLDPDKELAAEFYLKAYQSRRKMKVIVRNDSAISTIPYQNIALNDVEKLSRQAEQGHPEALYQLGCFFHQEQCAPHQKRTALLPAKLAEFEKACLAAAAALYHPHAAYALAEQSKDADEKLQNSIIAADPSFSIYLSLTEKNRTLIEVRGDKPMEDSITLDPPSHNLPDSLIQRRAISSGKISALYASSVNYEKMASILPAKYPAASSGHQLDGKNATKEEARNIRLARFQ